MLHLPLLQAALYPLAVLYLMLHAGPLLRLYYEPSIRGGTSWRFFASEVALFTGYLLFAPAIVDSTLGRVALATHITLHVAFTVMDYLAHGFMVDTALIPRARSLPLWLAKEGGLMFDTLTHAVAVALLAVALPLYLSLGLLPLSLLGFALITRGYLRTFRLTTLSTETMSA